MKKTLLSAAGTIFIITVAAAFNWPQNEILSDSFHSYFGQYRGGRLSSSLIFSDSEEIKVCEKGRVLAVLGEHNEDSELFESPLGNAMIVSHDDNMLTVYANLDEDFQEERTKMNFVESGTAIGACSNSAWQESESCLEFKVIDTKNKVFINPRILMPRVGQEAPLSLRGITAVNKKGTEYDLITQDSLPSGSYSIYQQRQRVTMPYRSRIYINGYTADSITYDTLITKSGRLCTSGNTNYTSEEIYPSHDRILLGHVNIPKGKVKMNVVLEDILGKEKHMTITFTSK